MISIRLSGQQVLDVDPKAIKQINITGNPEKDNGAIMFFIM